MPHVIGCSIAKTGFNISVDKKKLRVTYPKEVWQRFPKKIAKQIVENFSFLSTLGLSSRTNILEYGFNSPILTSFFVRPIVLYVPSCAEEYGRDSFSIFRSLMNTTYRFKSHNIKTVGYQADVNTSSIILFTFGKDSLLSYALAKEIGLSPKLVYIQEPDISYMVNGKKHVSYENKHKEALIAEFSKEFKVRINKIKNNVGMLRFSEFFGTNEAELPWGSQLTEYALLSLPFNHYFKARYIIYGNEASCSQTYYNKDKIMTNPVFDQSNEWTLEITKFLKLLTKNISAMSLLEPIHEIAIIKMLHKRYPKYAKYQMSCFADSNSAKHSRWCHGCSKCARVNIFLLANGIDPKKVGFKESMLTKDKVGYYSIFGAKDAKPYDLSGLGKDEQLLGFLMAYKRGVKGYLMKRFEKEHLESTKKREKRLMKEYFGIHESITLPKHIKDKVIAIYKEELE